MRVYFLKPLLSLLFAGIFALNIHGQDVQYGMAKATDDTFDGSLTAFGLIYRKSEYTAAHNLYPKGALLQVKRLDNKKTVQVKVIDRGPWIQGYVIDLSRAAATKLGIFGSTSAEVEVTLLKTEKESTGKVVADAPKSSPTKTPVTYDQTQEDKRPAASVSVNLPVETAKSIPTNVSPSTNTSKKVKKPESQVGVFKVAQVPDETLNYGVQIASLENPENLFEEIKRLRKNNIEDIFIVMDKDALMGDVRYKLILGAFTDSDKADAYKTALLKKYSRMKGCFVVSY